MVYESNFESMTDILASIDSAKPSINRTLSRSIDDSSWYGGVTFEQAKTLAVNGWDEGTKIVEQFSSLFIDRLGSQLKIDEYYYDVTGQDFDLDRVLIGEPESWLQTEQVEVKAPALQTLKLVVNIGASSALLAEIIMRKGAAIVALVNLLERTRRSVEIQVITRDCKRYGVAQDGYNFNFTAKQAGQDTDIAKMAFVLAHAGMLRRIQFAVMETVWTEIPLDYGNPSDLRKPDADIYIGCAHAFNDAFSSDKTTETWILEQLKAQGVELKES